MPYLRLAAAQLNTVVGDLSGNVDRVLAALAAAEAAGADICVVPELAIPGYPPEDLLLKPGFVADNVTALEKVAAATGDCAVVVARLAAAARDGTATREELSGSTITITSLGAMGGLVTTPIINHPEVAIIGVNKIVMRPKWDGSAFIPRKMMNLSSSFDHRVVDGWDAATFVQRIKAHLEAPALIFIEG